MKEKIKCLKRDSKYFPQKLKELEKCPEEIFVLGNEKILSEFSLSVVGSRKCSFFGKEIARKISGNLANSNITVVSGFARGIDTIAHKTCIENEKKTIAVLGGGHGNIYPNENKYMIEKILENGGAIISEYPYGYPSLPSNFIQRNRIVAALSEGVILIEAKRNSGSLYTIEYARKLNKKIFVVPGSLNDEMYEGSISVLVEGAYCVRNADDILNKYGITCRKSNISKTNDEVRVEIEYKSIFSMLSLVPISLEEICLKTNEPANKVLYKLTMLEMNGFIKQVGGQNFVRIK